MVVGMLKQQDEQIYLWISQPVGSNVSWSVWVPVVDHMREGTSLELARAPLKAESK